jgi:hypothetical protein
MNSNFCPVLYLLCIHVSIGVTDISLAMRIPVTVALHSLGSHPPPPFGGGGYLMTVSLSRLYTISLWNQ